MSIWHNEVFGAPSSQSSFVDDLDQSIEAVNDSTFGLSAALFPRDLNASDRFTAAVDTGQVAVNLPTSGWDVPASKSALLGIVRTLEVEWAASGSVSMRSPPATSYASDWRSAYAA